MVSGSDAAIAQLNTQLAKLVDVVNIHDMTLGEHFESELAMIKVKLPAGAAPAMRDVAARYSADVLDDAEISFTVKLTGSPEEIDLFIAAASEIGSLSAVARSGSVAVSKGEVTLSSYARHHRLTG